VKGDFFLYHGALDSDYISCLKALLSEEENLLIINRLHQVLRPFVLRRLKHKVFDFVWNVNASFEISYILAVHRATYSTSVKNNYILCFTR
jgi:hypothetical protein